MTWFICASIRQGWQAEWKEPAAAAWGLKASQCLPTFTGLLVLLLGLACVPRQLSVAGLHLLQLDLCYLAQREGQSGGRSHRPQEQIPSSILRLSLVRHSKAHSIFHVLQSDCITWAVEHSQRKNTLGAVYSEFVQSRRKLLSKFKRAIISVEIGLFEHSDSVACLYSYGNVITSQTKNISLGQIPLAKYLLRVYDYTGSNFSNL